MAYLAFGHKMDFYARGLRSIFLSRFFTHKPFLLSHLITTACNASCPYCYWKYPQKDELTTEEVKRLYNDARSEGFFISAIWGGEPLLRSDVAEVARYSKNLGFFTSVITNGYYLAERHEFAGSLDVLVVSLDDTETRHDTLRGVDGLFERALQGIELVRRKYRHTYITINCLLSELNIGAAERMIHLGRTLKIPVLFGTVHYNEGATFPVMPEMPVNLSASREALAEEFKVVKKYKDRGYAINTSYRFIDYFIEKRNHYHCHYPKVSIDIYSNGDVDNCFSGGVFENIRDHSLKEILRSKKFKDSQAKARRCTQACQWSDSIECSALYGFRWSSTINYAKVYRHVLDVSTTGWDSPA